MNTPTTDSITALVHGFYADVRADPLLGPVFEEAGIAHQEMVRVLA